MYIIKVLGLLNDIRHLDVTIHEYVILLLFVSCGLGIQPRIRGQYLKTGNISCRDNSETVLILSVGEGHLKCSVYTYGGGETSHSVLLA